MTQGRVSKARHARVLELKQDSDFAFAAALTINTNQEAFRRLRSLLEPPGLPRSEWENLSAKLPDLTACAWAYRDELFQSSLRAEPRARAYALRLGRTLRAVDAVLAKGEFPIVLSLSRGDRWFRFRKLVAEIRHDTDDFAARTRLKRGEHSQGRAARELCDAVRPVLEGVGITRQGALETVLLAVMEAAGGSARDVSRLLKKPPERRRK